MKTLESARIEKGIKQYAVADALKITRQTYAKYEKEPSKMPIDKAQAACSFIGVNFDEIFFSENAS